MRRVMPALVLSALALSLLAARIAWLHDLDRAFLGWNLVLAWAPLGLDALAAHLLRARSPFAPLVVIAWWLFFPNAIYLVTDLIYAGGGRGALRFYDAAMLGAFAFAGAALAIATLERMRGRVSERAGEPVAWCFAAAVWLTTGVGVWLGRVRRWNSWDALLSPLDVLRDAADLVLAPRAHFTAWALALVFAAMIAALHLSAARLAPTTRGDATVAGLAR